MALLQIIVGLTSLVVISNILSHFLKRVPVSLIQIGLGLLAALLFHVEIEVETEWFLLLFIAPLLYSDAWRFPKRELWELRGAIFGNAILLVFITTVLGGFLIYWLVPALPLPVALAIAAILSPTDPVAVAAIAKQAKLPPSIMHLVAGESLINDASGLVGFKFAVAAASVGTFSLFHATTEFLYISIAGTIVGGLLGVFLNWLGDWLAQRGVTDVVFRVVLQLFTPFLIFLLAEEIHASGVIAVVVAAIVQNLHTKNDIDYTGELHVVGVNTWNIFSHLLNGYIFVILGVELPVATGFGPHAEVAATFSLPMGLIYALGTWLIIFGLRVIWTYINQWMRLKHHPDESASWRVALLSGLSGVRGAVTMAGVLSVPLVTEAGLPFPERGLMLFIAAMVIVISLLAAVFFLPLLSEKPKLQVAPGEDHAHAPVAQHMSEARARIYVLQSAVREIETKRRESNQAIAYELILRYQVQIRQLQVRYMNAEKLNPILEAETTLREIGLEAEREAMRKLLVEEKITPLVFASESRRIDRMEAELDDLVVHKKDKRTWRQLKRFYVTARRAIRVWMSDDSSDMLRAEYTLAQHEGAKAAIAAISEYLSSHEGKASKTDQAAAYNLIISYRSRIEREKLADKSRNHDEIVRMELMVAAINAEREAVQHLYDAHFISYETGLKIRQTINFNEAGLLTDEHE